MSTSASASGSIPALSYETLLRHTENETRRWFDWLAKNPGALDAKTDIDGTSDVRGLVQHIVAVDLRYAERLNDMTVTPYEQIKTDLANMRAIAETAFTLLRKFLSSAGESDWAKTIEFPTRTMGTLTGSRRKIFLHTLLHGMRHWAQAAAILRSAGFKQDWQHDFLFSDVME